MKAYLGRLNTSPTVRAVLEALVRVTTYCHAPDCLDAASALDQVRLGFNGVIYVDGGWHALIAGLTARAHALNVRIHTGRQAVRVAADSDAVTLQFADGSARTTNAVILAVSPAEAAALAPWNPGLQRAADQARPVRVACLDLALADLPAKRRTYALGLSQPYYFSVHSNAARLAPAGGALLHVARYLADGEAPARGVIGELERLVDRLQPGWRPLEVARQTLPAMVVAHDLPQAATGGATGRPGSGAPGTTNLFIAGDWVGPTGLLADAAAASAVAASTAALTLVKGRQGASPPLSS